MKHLYLSSGDSLETFPDNKWFDFTVLIPNGLHLDGKYVCALIEVYFNIKLTSEMYVYSDLCEYSYIQDTYRPIMRIVRKTSVFTKLIYLPVKTSRVGTIRIYIRDKNNNIPTLAAKEMRCTILLKKKKIK